MATIIPTQPERPHERHPFWMALALFLLLLPHLLVLLSFNLAHLFTSCSDSRPWVRRSCHKRAWKAPHLQVIVGEKPTLVLQTVRFDDLERLGP